MAERVISAWRPDQALNPNVSDRAKKPDNPDRRVIAEAMATGARHVPFQSSPLLTALGCQIERASPGVICLRFSPGEAYVQGAGVVSGGITATMLDFALAFAGLTTCDHMENAASIGLNVQFLKPVKPGILRAEARLVSEGYRVAQAHAELYGDDGTLLATAQSPLAMKRKAS